MLELMSEGFHADLAWAEKDVVKMFNQQWINRLADSIAHNNIVTRELNLESSGANLAEPVGLLVNKLQMLYVTALLIAIVFSRVLYDWCWSDDDDVQG